MTPDQQQDRYDYILIARLRYPDRPEESVQAELEAAGMDFSADVSFAARLYALHSDHRELRRAVVVDNFPLRIRAHEDVARDRQVRVAVQQPGRHRHWIV